MTKRIECKCADNFTCGYCLRNIVYFFTPSTTQEIMQRQIGNDAKDVLKRTEPDDGNFLLIPAEAKKS